MNDIVILGLIKDDVTEERYDNAAAYVYDLYDALAGLDLDENPTEYRLVVERIAYVAKHVDLVDELCDFGRKTVKD